MAQVPILTGPERRGRFSLERKRAMVAATFAPGAVVAEVAIEVEFSGSLRLRVPAATPPELAAAVIVALRRR